MIPLFDTQSTKKVNNNYKKSRRVPGLDQAFNDVYIMYKIF
jgi:hypothetical protein